MNIRAANCCLLSASLLLAPMHLPADPASTDHGLRYELFSSVTGRWAKVNDVDPLKPMMGDHVMLAVSADESFEIVLSRVTESPDGLNVLWSGRAANDQYSHAFVTFIRLPGAAKRSFDSGSLTIPSQQRAFVFQAEKQRPGWVLVSVIEPWAPADLSCDTRDSCKAPATQPPAGGQEKRFNLFRPGDPQPPAVTPVAQAELQASPGGSEILYTRWVELNDLDPATLTAGDHILIEIAPGETIERVIARVTDVAGTGSRFVFGDWLTLEFARDVSITPTLGLRGGTLNIPEQGRVVVLEASGEMPGWTQLKEIKPGSGPGLEHDQVLVNKDGKIVQPDSASKR